MPTPPRQVLIVVALVAVALLLVVSEVVQQAWSRQAGLLEPWQRALAAKGLADGGGKDLNDLHELIHLQSEVATLRARLAEYDSIHGEGGLDPRQAVLGRARVLARMGDANPAAEPGLARILARSARQGRRYCEIDLGAIDGVEKGMAAIVGWSRVGVVDGVSEGRSLVRQLTDIESRVPAVLMAGEEPVAEGVIAGTGKRGVLTLEFVEDRQGLKVVPGQSVVTAALPPDIPRG